MSTDSLRRACRVLGCVCLVSIGLVCERTAMAQGGNRLYGEPQPILEPNARIGACTGGMEFTRDGQRVVIAGRDRVARVWGVSPKGLDPDTLTNLRWKLTHDRGEIYALAVSPDPAGRLVAIGGRGTGNRSLVILDRSSGEVLHGSQDVKKNGSSISLIESLTFSPSGNRLAIGTDDGQIGTWDLQAKGSVPVWYERPEKSSAAVSVVAFLNESDVLSVAADGVVREWKATGDKVRSTVRHRFGRGLVAAAVSPDRTRLAVADYGTPLEILLLKTGKTLKLKLADDELPQTLAFDSRGTSLAVGTRNVEKPVTFYKVRTSRVVLFDLTQASPRLQPGPAADSAIEAIAFHPDGQRLAVAGGVDSDVALWNLSDLKRNPQAARPSLVPGRGTCLWSVALDASGKHLGYRRKRVEHPTHPNHRGEGAWDVFDLHGRAWVAEKFQPVLPVDSLAGWRVDTQTGREYEWKVVDPEGHAARLPTDPFRDRTLICYTFLNPARADGPVRLAVGHQRGISVFQLETRKPPRLARLFVGHEGDVTAIAPSADHSFLLSASADQTIAGWSLAPWPTHPELGASFTEQGSRLLVTAVDPGSPAWEIGLVKDDQIAAYRFAGREIPGGPFAWLKQIGNLEPGQEFSCDVIRGALGNELKDLQRVLAQRPLWRFFADRGGEWVLWRWRDYFYDASLRGESLLGWQVSGPLDKTPIFHPSEQLRQRFFRPKLVTELLQRVGVDPTWSPIPVIVPPDVRVEVARQSRSLRVKVRVSSKEGSFVRQLREISLWVNDHRVKRWLGDDVRTTTETTVERTFDIPLATLRSGSNEIIAQAYNEAGERGDSRRETVAGPAPLTAGVQAAVNLYGLAVGINDYKKIEGFSNLDFPVADARDIGKAFIRQQGQGMFRPSSDKDDFSVLTDGEVTLRNVGARLRRIAEKARPDDWFVMYVSGHGYAEEVGKDTSAFAFVIPADFDPKQPLAKSGLTGQFLFDELSLLRCRKLVMLDVCHAHGSSEFIRELTPDGVGPIIFSACKTGEEAFEVSQLKHGVFTWALLQALTGTAQAAAAAQQPADLLSCKDLFSQLEAKVNEHKGRQTPSYFQRRDEDWTLPIFRRITLE